MLMTGPARGYRLLGRWTVRDAGARVAAGLVPAAVPTTIGSAPEQLTGWRLRT